MHPNTPPRIARLPRVIELTGLRKSAIYARIRAGDFPAPLQLGPRAIGWKESDVAAWIESRKPRAA